MVVVLNGFRNGIKRFCNLHSVIHINKLLSRNIISSVTRYSPHLSYQKSIHKEPHLLNLYRSMSRQVDDNQGEGKIGFEQTSKIPSSHSNDKTRPKEEGVSEKGDQVTSSSKKKRNRNRKKDRKSDRNVEDLDTRPKDMTENNSPGATTSTAGDKEKRNDTEKSASSYKNHKRRSNQKMNKLPEISFEAYITFEQCSEGLKLGELIQGAIRINPKNFADAFINSENGERDIHIEGVAARNRALPGDIVAVRLLPKEKWKRTDYRRGTERVAGNAKEAAADQEIDSDKYFQKTGKVVFIIEKKHSRAAAGRLNIYRNNAFGFALLSPVDNRIPRLMIPLTECPPTFKSRPSDFEKTLFIARISDWGSKMAFASGKLMRSLGEAGHIEPETEAIISENDIDSSPFGDDVLHCLPNGETWTILPEEIKKRKDLRKECIFTIDPATARDLDDALSCKKINDDRYEVGVHIADVSHFIEQGNALDKVAKQRATSVYLSQRVIPMLPRVLCEQLCSLNPGVSRLAYSVIWNVKADGTVLSEWFGRSVIRSCVKLSYNHAQQMIDSSENDVINPDEYPPIDGKFDIGTIVSKVKLLFGISKHLRKRRYDSGALRLDQPKLAFNLDSSTGLPNGCSIYEYKNSNRMIEEFMLLANMAVGRKIYKAHPDRAILRNHPPPHAQMMEDVLSICKQHNIPFDISDSASINKSLAKVSELDQELRQHMFPALVLLCTKPFQNAKYFCTGAIVDETAYRHYALNVPIYTHFTSPIRRYPDVLVHRFLTAALDKSYEVKGDEKELQVISTHCNDKKWAAKKASEQSSNLFFAIYVMECGPLNEKGVVVGMLDKAVDVLCTRVGIVKRVYCDKLSIVKHDFTMEELKPKITLYWEDESQKTDENLDERITNLTKKFEEKWAMQKMDNKDEASSNQKIPDDVIVQELMMFSPVDVVLTVERKDPTRINMVLKSPFVNDTPELGL